MSADAVIILRRKKFIRRFREKGAVSPDRAIPFSDLGMRRSWIFEQLVARGVVVPVGEDRFYLDEQAAEAFLLAQRRRALKIGAVLLALFALFLLGSFLW